MPSLMATNQQANSSRRARQPTSEIDVRRHRLKHQLGRRYASCSLANFAIDSKPDVAATQRRVVAKLQGYVQDMTQKLAEGTNIVLFGPVGTGKDHLLAALLLESVQHVDATWVNGLDLFAHLAKSFGKAPDTDLLTPLLSADLLAISDPVPPQGELHDWQMSFLFRLLDSRYRNCKPTWVTINARDGEHAEELLGVQIVDRLRHGAVTVACHWESYRKSR